MKARALLLAGAMSLWFGTANAEIPAHLKPSTDTLGGVTIGDSISLDWQKMGTIFYEKPVGIAGVEGRLRMRVCNGRVDAIAFVAKDIFDLNRIKDVSLATGWVMVPELYRKILTGTANHALVLTKNGVYREFEYTDHFNIVGTYPHPVCTEGL